MKRTCQDISKKSHEVSATINSLGTGKEPLRNYDSQDELSEIARVSNAYLLKQ